MKLLWSCASVVLGLVGLWIGWQVMTTMVGCVREPWDVYAMDTPPDVQCRNGGVGGTNLYVWKCLDGERVAISKFTGEMGAGRPHRDTGPCGEPTELEREATAYDRTCRPGGAPPWGGDSERVQIYERVYEPDATVDGDRAVRDATARARAQLAKLDPYAEVDWSGHQVILTMPAGASDAEIADADRIVGGSPMHLVSSGLKMAR